MKKLVLIYFFSLFYSVTILSQSNKLMIDTIYFDEQLDSIVNFTDQNVWVFCDTTHQLEYESIQKLSLANFIPLRNGQYELEMKHANHYWFRFIIKNCSTKKNAESMLYFGRADIAKLYQKTGKIEVVQKSGEKLNHSREIHLEERYFPIVIPAGEVSKFTFRVITVFEVFHTYPFSLQTNEYFRKKKLNEVPQKLTYHILQGIFFGFISFVVLFSIILFLLETDKAYLLYALYLFGIFTYYAILNSKTLATPFSYAIETFYPYKMTLSFFNFFVYLLFFREFLNLKTKGSDPVNKAIVFMAYFLLFLFITDLKFEFTRDLVYYRQIYDEVRAVLILIAFITIFVIFKSIPKDNQTICIILGTLSLLIFGVINYLFFMKEPGMIDGAISCAQIGVLVEILFFSLGLSLRSRNRFLSAQKHIIQSNLKRYEAENNKIVAQKDKALLQQQLAETELKALRAQINPHFISNALNAIKSMVQNNQVKKAEDYLADFSNLIRTILNNSNESFIPLQMELDYCELYLKIESLRFDKQFSYQIAIEDNIDTTYVKIPPLLLQPYIENAIWHGLLHKQGQRKLTISIKKEEDFIHCLIDDNGVGRKNITKTAIQNEVTKKSFGLSITNDRIKVNNELYEAGLKVKIIDKKSKPGIPTGTCVELIIPL